MTLEAKREHSSAAVDDYTWHDFLTEPDFRPEDLWAFDCEARSAGTLGPYPHQAALGIECPPDAEFAPEGEGPPRAEGPPRHGRSPESEERQSGREKPGDSWQQGAAPLSRRVWEPATRESASPDDCDGARGDSRLSGDAGLGGRVVLTGLETLDLEGTSEALNELAGLRSWADAMEALIASRLLDLTRDELPPRFSAGSDREDMARSVAASEVALVLKVPEGAAARLVDESVRLHEKHPATLGALESGAISRRHAVLIAEESLGMQGEAAIDFERDLLDHARGLTVSKLARRARRLREAHHPETLPVRKAKAVSERHIELRPDDDGMAWLHAYLPAEQACGIYERLTATARKLKLPDEPRTLGQLRADVFTDLLTSESAADGHPAWRGITAHVNVTVPVLMLLDVLKEGESNGPGGSNTVDGAEQVPDARGLNQFAELEGYGPIDAETAARLAAHAPSFTRILTHPVTGSVLDVGRETYRPPKHLQDWIRARDRTCRHAGCNRAAIGCEIDHTVPWARGGTTSHCNLACFCAKHHMYKSEGIFGYSQPSPGTVVVRTRAGTIRTSTPDPP